MDRRVYNLFNWPILTTLVYYTWYNTDYIGFNPLLSVQTWKSERRENFNILYVVGSARLET